MFSVCKALARNRKSSNPRQFFRPTWRVGLKADDDHGGLLEACQSTPLLYASNRAPKLQQRERGDSRGLRLLEEHDEIRVQWREQIERGWLQAQRGETVDGPTAMAWIKERIKTKPERASESGLPASHRALRAMSIGSPRTRYRLPVS